MGHTIKGLNHIFDEPVASIYNCLDSFPIQLPSQLNVALLRLYFARKINTSQNWIATIQGSYLQEYCALQGGMVENKDRALTTTSPKIRVEPVSARDDLPLDI